MMYVGRGGARASASAWDSLLPSLSSAGTLSASNKKSFSDTIDCWQRRLIPVLLQKAVTHRARV